MKGLQCHKNIMYKVSMKNDLCFSALKYLSIHLTLSIAQDILCHNIPPRGTFNNYVDKQRGGRLGLSRLSIRGHVTKGR